MTDIPILPPERLPEAVRAYREMTAIKHTDEYLAKHTTHHADCGCLTTAADAAIEALERLVMEQATEARKWRWAAEHDAWIDRDVGDLCVVGRDQHTTDLLLARYAEEVGDGID